MQCLGVTYHDSSHLLSAKGSVVCIYIERGGNRCGKMLVSLCEGDPAVRRTALSTCGFENCQKKKKCFFRRLRKQEIEKVLIVIFKKDSPLLFLFPQDCDLQ